MMKRFLSSLVLLSLSLGSVATFMAGSLPVQAAPLSAYIKGSGPTVYWHASNGRRYVFPNNATFQSWQASSPQSVTTIGDVELYTIPIGGNMTYRPGSRLVKITTDPRVYAVARYGVLRWVTNEQVARTIYGQNWAQMVDDLPDEFFANYTIGAPINSGSDYNASTEYNAVSSPNDNISTQASIGNGSNQNNQVAFTNMYVGLTANRENIPANDTNREVLITATVTNPSIPVDQLRIRIYDRNHGGTTSDLLLRTCEGVVTCTYTVTLPLQANTYSRQYLADISNRLTGQSLAYNPNLFLQAQGSGNTTQTNQTETVLPYGPYTCIQGYVWREAIPNDYVCVTPDVRTQAWADNAQAAARVSLTGGAYGPDTCLQGYVWRGARSEDHVCVLPWVRDQAQADNAQANARRVSLQGPTALNPTGVIVLSVDRSTIDSGSTNRAAVFTATVSNNTMPTDQVRIRLVNENTNTVERTCEDTLTCTFTYNAALNAPSASIVYRVELHNRATSVMVATPSRRTLTITGSNGNPTPSNRFSSNTSLQGTITERWTHAWGETVEYHADLITPPTNLNGVMIRVYDAGSGLQLWKDCPAMTQCAFTLTSLPRITRNIVARATDGAGTVISSNTITVTYGTQDTTTPLPSNTVSLTANRTSFNVGDSEHTLRLQATIQNPSINVNDLEIRIYKRNVDHDRLLQRTCTGTAQCSFEDPLYEFPSETWRQRYTYTAEFRSRTSGQLLATSDPVVVMLNPQAQSAFERFNTMVRVAVTNRVQNGQDENVTVKGYFENPAPVGSYMIMLYDADTGALLADRGLWHEVEYTFTGRAPQTRRVLAKAQDFSGKMIQSEVITIQFSGGAVQPTFQVTSVSSALDQNAANRCNEGFGVIGTITANGPGTVSYKWERSDGAIPPVETVTFAQAGSKTVTGSWFLSGTYAGWLRLKVLTPNEVTSNQTAIVSQCQASTPTLSGSIYTSTDPGEARPGEVVRVDANLTLSQSTGPVRVEIFNQDGQGIKTCWNMTMSGFCQAYQAVIPATAQGTYSFYAQAVDGYGNRLQSNWFAVRIR